MRRIGFAAAVTTETAFAVVGRVRQRAPSAAQGGVPRAGVNHNMSILYAAWVTNLSKFALSF